MMKVTKRCQENRKVRVDVYVKSLVLKMRKAISEVERLARKAVENFFAARKIH